MWNTLQQVFKASVSYFPPEAEQEVRFPHKLTCALAAVKDRLGTEHPAVLMQTCNQHNQCQDAI